MSNPPMHITVELDTDDQYLTDTLNEFFRTLEDSKQISDYRYITPSASGHTPQMTIDGPHCDRCRAEMDSDLYASLTPETPHPDNCDCAVCREIRAREESAVGSPFAESWRSPRPEAPTDAEDRLIEETFDRDGEQRMAEGYNGE